MIQPSAWNACRQRIAYGAVWATMPAPSAGTCVNSFVRSDPSAAKN